MEILLRENEIVVCEICGKNYTMMTGTKRCDRCWELEGRISRDINLSIKILESMGVKCQK